MKNNKSFPSINKLVDRIDRAKKTKSKEIRMDIDLADEVSSAILSLTTSLSEKDEEIIQLQNKVIELQERLSSQQEESNSEISFDAGGFKDE